MNTPKKITWNINSESLIIRAFIPNHPDINTKTFTQMIEVASLKKRRNELTGMVLISKGVGTFKAIKLA